MTESTKTQSPGVQMKNYFGCTIAELSAFRKADPEGYSQVSQGIVDGTLTY
jgi:hypothetical protein